MGFTYLLAGRAPEVRGGELVPPNGQGEVGAHGVECHVGDTAACGLIGVGGLVGG